MLELIVSFLAFGLFACAWAAICIFRTKDHIDKLIDWTYDQPDWNALRFDVEPTFNRHLFRLFFFQEVESLYTVQIQRGFRF